MKPKSHTSTLSIKRIHKSRNFNFAINANPRFLLNLNRCLTHRSSRIPLESNPPWKCAPFKVGTRKANYDSRPNSSETCAATHKRRAAGRNGVSELPCRPRISQNSRGWRIFRKFALEASGTPLLAAPDNSPRGWRNPLATADSAARRAANAHRQQWGERPAGRVQGQKGSVLGRACAASVRAIYGLARGNGFMRILQFIWRNVEVIIDWIRMQMTEQ